MACNRNISWVILFLLLAYSLAMANDKYSPKPLKGMTAESHTLRLVDEKVWVHIYTNASHGFTLVSLHDNENTGSQVAREYIAQNGGRLLELRHGRGRYVMIRRGAQRDIFDPNRMFSVEGMKKTLMHFDGLTKANLAVSATFSQSVMDLIDVKPGSVIVAVHNNSSDKLTIDDFAKGRWYGQDTKMMNKSTRFDYDDFFFTNHEPIYTALVGLNYNVALMSDNPADRGDLAVFVENKGAIYVNIEAQHGHYKEQTKMLKDLGRLLQPYIQLNVETN